MGYRTKNELEHFDFKEALIDEIREENGHLYVELGYVTILGNNSCNRDIRTMGTNALTLQLYQVSEKRLVREGYKHYDADGNLKGQQEDEVIPPEEISGLYQELAGSVIFHLEKSGEQYRFLIDGEERTYACTVKAEHDIEEWERFMNIQNEGGYGNVGI